MLRHRDLPPEEQSAAFRLADEMQRREREEAQEARSHAAAAEEMGVSQEYLDRAAEIVYAERVEQIRTTRRRRLFIGWTAGIAATVVLGTGLLYAVVSPRLVPTATSVSVNAAPFSVSLDTVDPSTNTIRDAQGDAGSFRFRIGQGSGNSAQGQVNAGFNLGRSLNGYRQLRVGVQGDGVQSVRIDLRNGDERWNSRELSVSRSGEPMTVRFDQLHRQVKQGNQWVDAPGGSPQNAKQIVFKFGRGVNPPETSGDVAITSPGFE